MHDGEVDIDERLARRIIADQFPQWDAMPVRVVKGTGTVNAIFRIGEHFAARFPLTGGEADAVAAQLDREANASAELADVCPFPTPVPVAIGAPDAAYPLPWSIQTWVPGTVATPGVVSLSRVLAHDLVKLVQSLRSAERKGRLFTGEGRGGNLQDSDTWVATCLRESAGMLPVAELTEMWARFRTLPDPGALTMTHGDLTPSNLVLDGERLSGVLDGGGFGAADPALDLIAGWHLLEADARAVFRAGLGTHELEWQRGAAWAFQQAIGLVWYYADSNPQMSALGRSTLRRLLDDPEIRTA